MLIADYIVMRLEELGVKTVFILPGGGAMYLNDAIAKNTKINAIGVLHEQAAVIAAEAYSKVSSKIGVAMVTNGPGATNTITGLASAWVDSASVLVIAGQSKLETLKKGTDLRQKGNQEIETVKIVEPITKYAVCIDNVNEIGRIMDRILSECVKGRPGPVWLEVPLDIQSTEINLPIKRLKLNIEDAWEEEERKKIRLAIKALSEASRPVMLVGNGVTISGSRELFGKLVDKLKIPVLTTWPAKDLISNDSPYSFGSPGTMAPRYSNKIIQNSDTIISIGTRLDSSITGYEKAKFAPMSKKIMIDLDKSEIDKHVDILSLGIRVDAKAAINELLDNAETIERHGKENWLKQCEAWKTEYDIFKEAHVDCKSLNTYTFTRVLSRKLDSGDLLIPASSGAAIEIFYLSIMTKKGVRLANSAALGSMGFGLPAAIGACAWRKQRTICIEGDGGIMMNIQELATLRRLDLPVKVFIINNGGYASIRSSQSKYFGRKIVADAESGLIIPSFEDIAGSYGINYSKIKTLNELQTNIDSILETRGPEIVEILVPFDEIRAPCIWTRPDEHGRLVSTALDDLYPFREDR